MDTLYFLQHYWWALVALLGAIQLLQKRKRILWSNTQGTNGK